MNWWEAEIFSLKRNNLRLRSTLLKHARGYFDAQGFDDVQTNILQIMPSPDTHIHSYETTQIGRNLKPLRTLGLHTSPEIAMKKLLVAGMEKIYQICPVFRNAEEGEIHSHEFTMIEWYRTDTDYTAMMQDCEALIKSLNIPSFTHRGVTCDVMGKWERLSVFEAFSHYAGIDLNGDIRAQAIGKGIRVIEDDQFEDIFHAVMAEKIEPNLGHSAPTILYDYPIQMAALARAAPDDRYAERFELYICGVELANAFSELTDAKEQRARLEGDLREKQRIYGVGANIDEGFIAALEHGMPESSGCALGFDRLVMLAAGADTIVEIQWEG